MPGVAGAPTAESIYMSDFGRGGWSTEGLLARAEPAGGEQAVLGWSRDLSRAVVAAQEPLLTLEPVLLEGVGDVKAVAGLQNYYVRGDAAPASYRLLAPGPGNVHFVGATPDGSRIMFEDDVALTPEAAASASNLYEWDDGRVSLAGVLPNGLAPVKGTIAGPGGPAVQAERGPLDTGGAADAFYTGETISEDGGRVFFSDVGTGFVYMREVVSKRTVQISGGREPAYWRDATPDGAYVFYTEGGELYRFNVNGFEESKKPEPEALAEARESLTTGAEGVLGTLGVSANGAYVYFVAPGKLASNKNSGGKEAVKGAANLYEWHNGITIFIASLNITVVGDQADWHGFGFVGSEPGGPDHGEKASRITPAGTSVLFSSRESLTGYENNGNIELYLFDAASGTNGRLACVSCNPGGVPATSSAHLGTSEEVAIAITVYPFTASNLSADGGRVFFQTAEALVPGDSNGVDDVYEWEREGVDGCAQGAGNPSGGCLYLISTGQGTSPSYFGDASASGSEVFFFTRQSLVGQDKDENQDLYDASENGGLEGQNPVVGAPCEGEGCRGEPASPPLLSVPSSTTFSGLGNPVTEPQAKPAVAKAKSKPSLTRAQKLANALSACRRNASKKKRVACEAQARKRYGGKAAKSSSGAHKRDRGRRS
jgi:hypothetical protein